MLDEIGEDAVEVFGDAGKAFSFLSNYVPRVVTKSERTFRYLASKGINLPGANPQYTKHRGQWAAQWQIGKDGRASVVRWMPNEDISRVKSGALSEVYETDPTVWMSIYLAEIRSSLNDQKVINMLRQQGLLTKAEMRAINNIDEAELQRHGIKTVAKLPGVGRNFQDHVLVAGCVWEYNQALPPANNAAEATFFWKSDSALPTPDLQPFQIEVPFTSEVTGPQFKAPAGSWTIAPGLVRPKSRGRVTLASAKPADMALVDGAFLSHPDDVKALLRGIELCREIGNSAAMKEYVKREVMPGPLGREAMTDFLRNAAGTYYHQSCTCKMGRDEMSVVDGQLSLRGGIEGLSIADASVMPTVSTGNTMAPTVIIGERMADILIARR
jgi:choline dehydrogenase-like flavoprotein